MTAYHQQYCDDAMRRKLNRPPPDDPERAARCCTLCRYHAFDRRGLSVHRGRLHPELSPNSEGRRQSILLYHARKKQGAQQQRERYADVIRPRGRKLFFNSAAVLQRLADAAAFTRRLNHQSPKE